VTRIVVTVAMVTAAWLGVVVIVLVTRVPKQQPVASYIVPQAMAKADRLDLAQRRLEDVPPAAAPQPGPIPVPNIPPEEVEEEVHPAPPRMPVKAKEKDICEVHGMRKQWYNKNRSWRCVHA